MSGEDARGLHEGVDGGGTDESEPGPAERSRQVVGRFHLAATGGPGPPGFVLDPGDLLETAVRAKGYGRSGVRAGGIDLGSVPDDLGIESDGLEVSVAHLCDVIRDEAGEGTAERWSLLEDDEAGQPRLEPLQHESLVERLLITHGEPHSVSWCSRSKGWL